MPALSVSTVPHSWPRVFSTPIGCSAAPRLREGSGVLGGMAYDDDVVRSFWGGATCPWQPSSGVEKSYLYARGSGWEGANVFHALFCSPTYPLENISSRVALSRSAAYSSKSRFSLSQCCSSIFQPSLLQASLLLRTVAAAAVARSHLTLQSETTPSCLPSRPCLPPNPHC